MSRNVGAVVAFGLVLLLGGTAVAQDPIVYVRCARTAASVEMSGDVTVGGVSQRATRTMQGFDAFDVLPDVTHFLTKFSAPCDLVYRESSGDERIFSSDAARLYEETSPR